MKRFFTLIELIVVIAVLGILAAIIIPNISSFQEEANTTAIVNNVRNLQTGVDMYSMDNYGDIPTLEGNPTEYEPKPIDFEIIHPDYTRDLPETPGVKYWVDGWGKVWASTIDAPENVDLTSTTLKWDSVPEADIYKVYKVLNPTNTSSLLNSNTKLVFYKEATKDKHSGFSVDDENAQYAVSAVDNNKFESAPAGSGYKGFDKYISSPEIPQEVSQPIVSEDITLSNYTGVIYVDGINGDNSTGDGTETKPFKTLGPAYNSISSDNTLVYIVAGGTYVVPHGIQTLLKDNLSVTYAVQKSIRGNVVFDVRGTSYNPNINMTKEHKFIGIIFKRSGAGDTRVYEYFYNASVIKIKFYNCVFDTGSITPNGGVILVNNNTSGTYDENIKDINFIHSAIVPSSLYWNDQDIVTIGKYKNTALADSNFSIDSYNLQSATFDSNYNITSGSWQNAGTGTDNDGSVADIGIYGGQYSW